MVALEGMAPSNDDADSMESESHGQQEPRKDGARGVEDMTHRMSDPNDFKGRGVDVHVATMFGAGCMESPDYFDHIPFVFEISENPYFHGEISRDPDGMAAVVASEWGPFLDILPHVGIIIEMNPRHVPTHHSFTNRLAGKGHHMAIPCAGIFHQ